MHERVASPSMCTVQAPHRPNPHPNFVPVIPNTSRNTQSTGVSPSTVVSTGLFVPLTFMWPPYLSRWGEVAPSSLARKDPGAQHFHIVLPSMKDWRAWASVPTSPRCLAYSDFDGGLRR